MNGLVDSNCSTCKYRGRTAGGMRIDASEVYRCCHYILVENHSRGCPPGRECTKKVCGPAVKLDAFGVPLLCPKKRGQPTRVQYLAGRQTRAIEELLATSGKSVSQIARELNVWTQQVSAWKTEERFANWDKLEAHGYKRPEYCPTRAMVLEEIKKEKLSDDELLRSENGTAGGESMLHL